MDDKTEFRKLSDRIDQLESMFNQRLEALESVKTNQINQTPPIQQQEQVLANSLNQPPIEQYNQQPINQIQAYPPNQYQAHSWQQQQRQQQNEKSALSGMSIESILRWVGISLVTLAAFFLAGTAISRGWISQEIQLLTAATLGTAMLAVCFYMSKNRTDWALLFGVSGSLIVMSSGLASHEWKQMVSPSVALALLSIAAIISLAVAMVAGFDKMGASIFVIATVLGLPLAEKLGETAPAQWVFILLVSASALGLVMRWNLTRLIGSWWAAWVFTYLIFNAPDGYTTLINISLSLIAALLWFGTIPFVKEDSAQQSQFDILLRSANVRSLGIVPGWLAVSLLHNEIDPEWIFLGVAAVFFVLTCVTYNSVSKISTTSTLLGAFGVLSIGLILLIEGPVLIIALTAQASGSYFIAKELKDTVLEIFSWLLGTAATLLSVFYIAKALPVGFETLGGSMATAFIVAIWILIAYFTYENKKMLISFPESLCVAWILSMSWIIAALANTPQGMALASVIWATMAIFGIMIGLTKDNYPLKMAGLLTLGATVFKLLTIDLSGVDVFVRVGVFFAIGIGLIILGLKVPNLVGRSTSKDKSSD